MDIDEQTKFEINTQFVDEFSKEIYEQTYRYGSEDINQTQLRVAKDLASIEKDKDFWTQEFLWALEDFKFSPGGRITSNAGTGLKGTTYINCFVSGPDGEDQDSMEGILGELRQQALILKSEGGYGFCADFMRPRGSFINGIGNESPGSVRMLDMWDTQSSVITEGSGNKTKNEKGKVKIRKGAQMVTLSCFSENTLILTNLGWVNVVELICRIKDGELINAIDEYGNENNIINPIIKEPERIYRIETENGDIIEVTGDHKFEVKNINTGDIYLKSLKDIDIDIELFKIIENHPDDAITI